jgi:hypothetical protein
LEKYIESSKEYDADLVFIKENFLGHVVSNSEKKLDLDDDAVMYFCGDIKNTLKEFPLSKKHKIFIIKELSKNYEDEVENRYIEKVDYGKIHFTMNKGDLEMPKL